MTDETLDNRMARLEGSYEQIDRRLGSLDERMESRFAEANARMESRFAEADARMESRFAELHVSIARNREHADAHFLWMIALLLTSLVLPFAARLLHV